MAINKNSLPDILILGAGPYIKNISHFPHFLDDFTREVVDFPNSVVAARFREHNKSLHMFWKTQQPGGCLPTISHPAKDNKSCLDKQPKHAHNWDKFMDWDEQTIHQLLTQTKVGIIDMRMLYLRTDAHNGGRDCLHYNMLNDVLFSTFPRMVMDSLHNINTTAAVVS